jgi:caffeoyl-CoA O-methyltransferase
MTQHSEVIGVSDANDAIKSLGLSTTLHEYLVAHGTPPDSILQGLIDETHRLGGISMMQVAPEQGAFMMILTRLLGARRAIEVGTFTGYSALSIARGLPDDGLLICCDVSEEWTSIGRPYWEKSGVANKIDLRLAPGIETLTTLARDPAEKSAFDLAFIDAVKTEYQEYLELLHELIRPGGAILVDNVLWGGSVIDETKQDESTRAIRAFNDRLETDDRFDRVMLPISDGLTLLRVR